VTITTTWEDTAYQEGVKGLEEEYKRSQEEIEKTDAGNLHWEERVEHSRYTNSGSHHGHLPPDEEANTCKMFNI